MEVIDQPLIQADRLDVKYAGFRHCLGALTREAVRFMTGSEGLLSFTVVIGDR